MNHYSEDRPERIDASSIYQNPSAPLTETEMDSFIHEASRILTEALTNIEHGKEHSPC